MEKQITIIIPTYNMEAYIGKCLDTLLIPEIDQVEVLVVNDGSKDCSSEIAHGYEARYPQSIRVIDKPNGNYGSCINAALPQAKGRYVKILDADDWFDTKEFSKFVDILKRINTDVVFTHHSIHYLSTNRVETFSYPDLLYRENLSLNDFTLPRDCLKMHCLSYRTEFLKEIGYHQTEGVSYTDNEYVVLPLLKAHSFTALENNVYQYRIGRGEQTVSLTSMVKNVDNYLTVLKSLSDSYSKDKKRNNSIKKPIVIRLMCIIMDIFIIYRKNTTEQFYLFKEIALSLSKEFEKDIKSILSRKIKFLPLYAIWFRTNMLYNTLVFPVIRQTINY